MEVHPQRCPSCGSLQHNALLLREPGRPDRVYLRCARCARLVARYALSASYHHGKGLDSYLRGLDEMTTESGREALDDYRAVQEEAEEEYARVLEELEREGKEL